MQPGSFREAFDTLAPALLRYVRRLTGSRVDAEEMVQDAFLKLHCEIGRGVELSNVRAWLFRVVTNAARDRERENRVRAREDGFPARAVVDLESHIHTQQVTRRTLQRLPRRMRQVLLLWSEGFSYREMAEIAGVEAGYVGVLLQRARAAFKKEFEQVNSGLHRRKESR